MGLIPVWFLLDGGLWSVWWMGTNHSSLPHSSLRLFGSHVAILSDGPRRLHYTSSQSSLAVYARGWPPSCLGNTCNCVATFLACPHPAKKQSDLHVSRRLLRVTNRPYHTFASSRMVPFKETCNAAASAGDRTRRTESCRRLFCRMCWGLLLLLHPTVGIMGSIARALALKIAP